MLLAENESLHCNFMLSRCRAPFWRARVIFVWTWITIASTLQQAILCALSCRGESNRLKKPDREALKLDHLSLFWWIWLWYFSSFLFFCITSISCSGLTKRYYLWNATTHPLLQLCRTPCHQINSSMRQWTKKCSLPGTIIVTGCKCTRLCHAHNHPSAAGDHGSTWWWVSGGQ